MDGPGESGQQRAAPRVTAVPVVRDSAQTQRRRQKIAQILFAVALLSGPLALLLSFRGQTVVVPDDDSEEALYLDLVHYARAAAENYLAGTEPDPAWLPVVGYDAATPEEFEAGGGSLLDSGGEGLRLILRGVEGRDLYHLDGTRDVPTSWEVSFSVEVTGEDANRAYSIRVPMNMGTDGSPVLAAMPYLAPLPNRLGAVQNRIEPIFEDKTAGNAIESDPALAGKGLVDAANAWASAYAVGNSPDPYSSGLARVAAYPGGPVVSSDLRLAGLRGFECVNAGACAEVLWAAVRQDGETYARARLAVRDSRSPSGQSPLIAVIDVDLLLANARETDQAQIAITSWGPAGSGPYLVPYEPIR